MTSTPRRGGAPTADPRQEEPHQPHRARHRLPAPPRPRRSRRRMIFVLGSVLGVVLVSAGALVGVHLGRGQQATQPVTIAQPAPRVAEIPSTVVTAPVSAP